MCVRKYYYCVCIITSPPSLELSPLPRAAEFGEPSLRQPLQQDRSILAISVHVFHEFFVAVKRRQRRVLRDGGRVDEEILLQSAHGWAQRGGYDAPTHAPSGHAVIFTEGVDH